MVTLAVKTLAAPALALGVSFTARRFGPWVGGVVSGLPVVAGPILLVYALVHGTNFAEHAAGGTLLGMLSVTAFVVVYGHLAHRMRWMLCLLAGWSAFAAMTLALDTVTLPVGPALMFVGTGFALGLLLLPRTADDVAIAVAPPSWDLPARALCALALVLVITTASGWLGPRLSGLLTAFPVMTTVLATFTHAQRGAAETVRLLRGMLSGFGGIALFCVTVKISLPSSGPAAAFGMASAVALVAQAAIIIRNRSAPVAIRLTSRS